jgi:hypothetical protein
MTTSQKIIPIGQIKEIILINNDIINFSAHIIITAKSPFFFAIVTEQILDTVPELQYKHITDTSIPFEFQIQNDNNIFSRYFVVVKSDTPQDIEFTCTLNETPLTDTNENCNNKTFVQERFDTESGGTSSSTSGTEWYYDWRYIAIILVIIGFIIYWFYYRKKDNGEGGYNESTADIGGVSPRSSVI